MCDLVKKSEGGGGCFLFREGGSIGMGGPLAWGEGGRNLLHPVDGSVGPTLAWVWPAWQT